MATRMVVHGRVQGVFFRASTRDLAARHGVAGWVRNDPNGTVTVHLEGPQPDVDTVAAWVRGGGPPDARVQHVDEQAVADEALDGFRIRR